VGALYLLALPSVASIVLSKPFAPLGLVPVGLIVVLIPVGLALGARVGFRSVIADRVSGWPTPGLASGIAHAVAGGVFLGFLWAIPARMLSAFPESVPIVRWLLQGAIPEEFIFRWGGMSLGVFVLWRLLDRNSEKPGALFYWVALVSTSAVFASAHLGSIWHAGSSATDPYGIFMLAVNFIAGMVFGWVFWKKGLEFAMATHGVAHVVIWLFSFCK